MFNLTERKKKKSGVQNCDTMQINVLGFFFFFFGAWKYVTGVSFISKLNLPVNIN